MSTSVVVVGSLNMDLVVRTARAPGPGETVRGTDFRQVPGGKGANQALAAARLGAGVALVGRVGADAFGQSLVEGLEQDDVSSIYVERDSHAPTGVALITVEDSGENRIVIYPGANGQLSREDVAAAEGLIAGSKWLLLQLEVPLEAVAHAAETAAWHGVGVILNPAPAQPLPAELLHQVNILVPNETEAALLSGKDVDDLPSAEEAGRLLLATGPQAVIITLGERGALLVSEVDLEHIPAPEVNVVDTTAAGDAFVGGLAAALVRGLSLLEAVRFGVCAGSLAATRFGAQTSLPKRHEVETLVGAERFSG